MMGTPVIALFLFSLEPNCGTTFVCVSSAVCYSVIWRSSYLTNGTGTSCPKMNEEGAMQYSLRSVDSSLPAWDNSDALGLGVLW
jgi:hypothetical protein